MMLKFIFGFQDEKKNTRTTATSNDNNLLYKMNLYMELHFALEPLRFNKFNSQITLKLVKF